MFDPVPRAAPRAVDQGPPNEREEVGAFTEADIVSVTEANRAHVAEKLMEAMVSQGLSTITLSHANVLMREFDPIADQMSDLQSKLRIERMFTKPYENAKGSSLVFKIEGRDKFLALG